MESNLEHCSKLGHPAESSDAKYISGLSTILVATIQEAKDRISQIEYIFCSQLFPKFQLNCQALHKVYSEARKAAEDAFREKEKELLLQIKKLQFEKEQVLEENHLLKLEKANFVNKENQSCNRLKELQNELTQKTMEIKEGKEVQTNLQKLLESKSSLIRSYENTIVELEHKVTMLMKKQRCQEVDADLRLELMKKSKEVDDVMERQNKLLQINQSKDSLIVQKEVKLKEYEQKVNELNCKLANMEKNVDELLSALKERTAEVEKGKELQGNLLKKIEFQASEIMNTEQMLSSCQKENRLLTAKIENLPRLVDELQKKLSKKNNQLEEGRKVHEKLLQQIDSFNTKCMKRGTELEEFEEKKLLLDKQKGLEEKVDQLRESLYKKSKESCERMELHGELLQQIKVKDSEIQSEKRRRKESIDAYKKLKSQYNYLLEKTQPPETKLHHKRKEDECETIRGCNSPLASHGEFTKRESKQELPEDVKQVIVAPRSSPASPSTSNILSEKCHTSVRSCPPAGVKRPSSSWRDTRPNQSRLGPGFHDDFLDTPLENMRKNTGKVMKEEIHNIPKPGLNNMNLDSSDGETQDMNVDPGAEKPQMPPPQAGPSGYKYVEPVRKKADRENLKGVECKQCKKFYDVVLPEAEKKSDGSNQSIRCEHHDGVSRHRYKYAPPLTPEGFWNIGFESEIWILWNPL